nr:aminoglycoside adenylyltransferase domain-containing protein [Bowdeniella massiliensis]
MITRRSLSCAERRDVVSLLLACSGWRGHAARFPEAQDRRPIELTSVVRAETVNWEEVPARDFQYGEWLRHHYVEGELPVASTDPDVTVLTATAQQANQVLLGPPLTSLLPTVPTQVLRRAVADCVEEVVAGVEGDECNVLLTLARILVTLETGKIVPKDEAVGQIGAMLSDADRAVLERARDRYLGIDGVRWTVGTEASTELAHRLAKMASRYVVE